MISQGGFPAILRFSANFLEHRVKGIEQALGEWDSAGDATVVEAELEAALTALESNELSNLAHADKRRHA